MSPTEPQKSTFTKEDASRYKNPWSPRKHDTINLDIKAWGSRSVKSQ